jgi:hypothetical protein
MEKITLNYISEDGDFSKTFLECHDTYEGYTFLAKRLYLSDPDAAPIISDLSLLIKHFIKLDIYNEWQVARVTAKKVTENQNAQPIDDSDPDSDPEADPIPVEETSYIDLSLLYIRRGLEKANKDEKMKSNEMGALEGNVTHIWDYLEALTTTIKEEKAIDDKAKRDVIDAKIKKDKKDLSPVK